MAYFDGIQVGDKVWSVEFGRGKVVCPCGDGE